MKTHRAPSLGFWCRAFVMGSPCRVESVSVLDRNVDSYYTFSVFGRSLRDEVTLMGRGFLRSRSDRRLFEHLPYSWVPSLRDGGHPYRVVLHFAAHSIGTKTSSIHLSFVASWWGHPMGRVWFSFHSVGLKSSLDSWSVFLQDGVILFGSSSNDLISIEGIATVGLLGAFFRPILGGEFLPPWGRLVCSEVRVSCTFSCLHFWWGLCVSPSRQWRRRSWPFFFWPCCLSPSPRRAVCFSDLVVILFTRAFHVRCGSLVALPDVGLLGKGASVCAGCLRFPASLLSLEWGRYFCVWHSGTGVASGNVPSTLHGVLPCAGPRIVLGAAWSPSGHTRCVFLLWDALFILASTSAERLGLFHAMSFPGSLSWSRGGVSSAFVMGFVATTQALPLLLGLRASLYRPNQRETIAMGDSYILCRWSGFTWSAWAAHRQRCERFPFAARCNRKELSKTAVSFWLRMPLSRMCCLSVTVRSVLCPSSSVRSCYRSVSSLWRTLLSSWWRGESLAFALFLAGLLGNGCSSVPRSLPPVLCGSGAGPGLSRACWLRNITTYDL